MVSKLFEADAARRSSGEGVERTLLVLAALFVGLYAVLLTFAPGVRSRGAGDDLNFLHWIGYLVWVLGFTLAHRVSGRLIPARDPYLLPITAILSGWGLMTIWRLFPDFGTRQTIWIAIAFCVLILGMRLSSDLEILRRYKYLWLTGGLLLTGLTLIFGTNPLGAGPRLWLGCCGVYLQPSEPLKLLLIVYLAAYFADRLPFLIPYPEQGKDNPRTPRSLVSILAPTLIMAGLAFLILLVQRDLGTASIFLILYATVIFIATGDRSVLVATGLALMLAVLVGYFAFDLVRLRVEAWINPWLDPSGRSFQIVQSLLAIANGGLFGRGPGLGSPSLVPIAHSDFIFSAISEEAGLVGGIALLIILGLIAQRGLTITMKADRVFHRYLAAGLTSYLIFQSLLIIGGNLRLLPLTGVTLPFVSYGGSSLLTSFITLMILLLISSRSRKTPPARVSLVPYSQLGNIYFGGVILIALGLGWWAFIRGPDLLTRTDNPRRAISDRFVQRGSIIDRNNSPINVSIGSPGEYQRTYFYPWLSGTSGYTSSVYGQSALEASMDPVLRGLEGNPGFTIWWNHLLYGQPPTGLDIRTTINLDFQELADQALSGDIGAAVLLDAENGEILTISSNPSFDANELDEIWGDLINDPDAPLVNRVTQRLYSPGTALAPLILAQAIEAGKLDPSELEKDLDLDPGTCALQMEIETWGDMVRAGCSGGIADLGERVGGDSLLDLYRLAGLFEAPRIQLPVESMAEPDGISYPGLFTAGESVQFNPLQIGLAVSALSAEGVKPAPLLVGAIDSPQLGWLPQTAEGDSSSLISLQSALLTGRLLQNDRLPVWESAALGSTVDDDRSAALYVSGTTADWAGPSLILVVVLEDAQPDKAVEIGQKLWRSYLSQ